MIDKILCVDDEQNVLDGYNRLLRREFQIDTASGGEQALKLIQEKGPYAVIVTDMRMPGMDGVQFLAHANQLAPATVRIMLSGNADQQTAVEALNEGHIFRYLTKPCSPETLKKSLQDAIHQHRLIRAEKELLESTLSDSIQVLTEVLGMVNPTAFGRASRVRRLVQQISAIMKVENAWRVDVAAMLSQIGCITIPEETLAKVYEGKSLTGEEERMLKKTPKVGHDLIARIPRMEAVAEIIAYQNTPFSGSSSTSGQKSGFEIPLGARILKIALDFDKLIEAKVSSAHALNEIRDRPGVYDPAVVQALSEAVGDTQIMYAAIAVKVRDLVPKMILAEDIRAANGILLIAKGQEISPSLCLRLDNLLLRGTIGEPIRVFAAVDTPAYRRESTAAN